MGNLALAISLEDSPEVNDLRPCPMLENPRYLQQMASKTGAKSTDIQSPESEEHLCAKGKDYAEKWITCADAIWNGEEHKKPPCDNYKK